MSPRRPDRVDLSFSNRPAEPAAKPPAGPSSFRDRLLARAGSANTSNTSPIPPAAAGPDGRSWLGVYFRCCNIYGRIYRVPGRPRYAGCCPRCGGEISARVGEGGTDRRFFEAV